MLVCRRGRTEGGRGHPAGAEAQFQGGPVFLPRRKPSPLAAALMARRPSVVDLPVSDDDASPRGRPAAEPSA